MSRSTTSNRRLHLYRIGNDRCPICLAPFSKNAVESGQEVTLEHVPPKGLCANSIAMCLTCAKCNSAAGKGVDPAAITLERQKSEGIKVVVDFPLRPLVTGKIMLDSRQILVIGRSGDNPPQLKAGETIKFSVKLPEPRLAAVSHLKSAYLSVFSLLGPCGYRYAKSKALLQVREQIMSPADEIIKYFAYKVADPSRYSDGIIMDRERKHWAVKIGDCFVFLPKGGDESFYEKGKVTLNGDHGTIDGHFWQPVKFDPRNKFQVILKEDSAAKAWFGVDNLFGKDGQVAVDGVEIECVVADHQGLEVTLVPKPSTSPQSVHQS